MNDFETVRLGLNWKGSGSETPARRAALKRIEAEVERLREERQQAQSRVLELLNEVGRLNTRLSWNSERAAKAELEVKHLRAEIDHWEQVLPIATSNLPMRTNREDTLTWIQDHFVEDVATEAEVERLRAVFSRYGDHDRACDARVNSLHACTCGFVERVNTLFPGRTR